MDYYMSFTLFEAIVNIMTYEIGKNMGHFYVLWLGRHMNMYG